MQSQLSRQVLPQRRACETYKIEHRGISMHITVGYYEDDSIGEVFINTAKTGEALEVLLKDCAVIVSIAIQHGVAPECLYSACKRDSDGAPGSFIGAVLRSLLREGRTEP